MPSKFTRFSTEQVAQFLANTTLILAGYGLADIVVTIATKVMS